MRVDVVVGTGKAKCSQCGMKIPKGTKCCEIRYRDGSWYVRKKVCRNCMWFVLNKLELIKCS